MNYYGYGLYYDVSYFYVIIICLLLIIPVQLLVKRRYSKYSKIRNSRGITGADAARKVLEQNGVYGVRIEQISGKLSDHYDPKTNVIRLSKEVYNNPSIAAVGIAAHEAGHAVQHANNYFPIKVRTAVIPFAQYGPTVGIILLIVGSLINMFELLVVGIILFGATFVFQFVTLPVEFNASRRALAAIREGNLLLEDEYTGAKRMLTAAALTYVAAMLQALIQLLYYAMRFLGRRSNR